TLKSLPQEAIIKNGEFSVIDEYDSDTSPLIDIEWRSESTIRNKRWQLDRALHALHVYANLYEFRKKCALINEETGITLPMAYMAQKKGNYLINKLLNYKTYFTKDGLEYINYTANKIKYR
ncbi:MAG: hypothetical protein ACO2ZM_07655, partial [Francisellaceae bacterium]